MLNDKERLRPRDRDEAQQEARDIARLMGEHYVLESDPTRLRGCYPDDMVDALVEYQAALARVRAAWQLLKDDRNWLDKA